MSLFIYHCGLFIIAILLTCDNRKAFSINTYGTLEKLGKTNSQIQNAISGERRFFHAPLPRTMAMIIAMITALAKRGIQLHARCIILEFSPG
jgi:hypothetical protein